jgi:hypothetical protein
LKLGLPTYKGGIYTAKTIEAYKKENSTLYKLEFDKIVTEKYGLPYAWVETDGKNFELKWFGKKASRLPQAFWLKFKGMSENWELNKLGIWIKPEDIIGSPLISAVGTGVRNDEVEIKSLDAGLVAPFGRKLLRYNESNLKQDLYFNLYNNIWNTNFPMWYSDDSLFRFEIQKRI